MNELKLLGKRLFDIYILGMVRTRFNKIEEIQ
jgi:hypothetical protein